MVDGSAHESKFEFVFEHSDCYRSDVLTIELRDYDGPRKKGPFMGKIELPLHQVPLTPVPMPTDMAGDAGSSSGSSGGDEQGEQEVVEMPKVPEVMVLRQWFPLVNESGEASALGLVRVY